VQATRPIVIDRGEVLAQLKRHAILVPLGDVALAGLLAYAVPRVLRARGKLFSAGDPGSAVYLVLSACLGSWRCFAPCRARRTRSPFRRHGC
jgi:hypothetical protein